MDRSRLAEQLAWHCWSILRVDFTGWYSDLKFFQASGVEYSPAAVLMTADRVSYQRRQHMGRAGLLDGDPVRINVREWPDDWKGPDIGKEDGTGHPTVAAGAWSNYTNCLLQACRHWCGLPAPDDVIQAAAHYRALAASESDVARRL